MSLFSLGTYTLHSGEQSPWIIDCNALTDEDWETLALMARLQLIEHPFGSVEGIPEGGLRFAKAMEKYITPGAKGILIVDDVCTTGASFEEARARHDGTSPVVGVCAFSRGICPWWVIPVFEYLG